MWLLHVAAISSYRDGTSSVYEGGESSGHGNCCARPESARLGLAAPWQPGEPGEPCTRAPTFRGVISFIFPMIIIAWIKAGD